MAEGLRLLHVLSMGAYSVPAALLLFLGPCLAPARADTVYSHYEIEGSDALDIMRAITERGPNVHGVNAVASIRAEFEYSHDDVRSANQCRAANFRIKASFHIRLPRLADEEALSPETRKAWQAFYAHARWHEEEHRRIHLACVRQTERDAAALPAFSDCEALRRAIEELREASLAQCRLKHQAFDQSEARRFPRLPMVQEAMRASQRRSVERAQRISQAPQMPDWFYNRR